jgi:hypothetical protein
MSENAKRLVISTSPDKNLVEVVYHETLPSGKKTSVTRFEPLNFARQVYRRKFGKERDWRP